LEGRAGTGLSGAGAPAYDRLDEKLSTGPDDIDTEVTEVDDTSGPKLLDRIDAYITSLADD
jgi:hypothetical protein